MIGLFSILMVLTPLFYPFLLILFYLMDFYWFFLKKLFLQDVKLG